METLQPVYERTSPSFIFQFFGASPDEETIQEFIATQEADVATVRQFLGVDNDVGPYQFLLYPTLADKQAADPHHSTSRASARAGEQSIYRVFGPEMPEPSFPHELVHLVMHDNSPTYLWEVQLDNPDGSSHYEAVQMDSISFLQEGLAVTVDELAFGNKLYEAGEYRFADEWVRHNANEHTIAVSDILHFDGLSEQNPVYATPVSASFCKYLITTYGMPLFLDLYRSCHENDTLEQTITEFHHNYGKGLVTLETEWRQSLAKTA